MNNIEENIVGLLKKTNTSYKYFFLLACIESVKLNQFEYSFNELSKAMVAEAFIYGDFVSDRYTKNDRMFDLMGYLVSKNTSFALEKNVFTLIKLINENEDQYVKKMLNQIVLYVPYRLIVTEDFSHEVSGLRDSLKNKKIKECSHLYETIYSIENKSILWNKKYYDYILQHKHELIHVISELIRNKFARK